jgi:hypothetical protein
MAPINNQNMNLTDRMTLVFGIFGLLLAFLGVVVGVQTWRAHHRQQPRGQHSQGK